MVTIVKHEWHQTDRQYAMEIDEDLLSEIYPDLDEDEIAAIQDPTILNVDQTQEPGELPNGE